MKENLPNDGLEKFLKKSFDGYEDTPSGNLWDKISGELDAPVGGLPKSVPIYKTWWAGAAAALFVGVISAQFIYFQNRIDNLTQEVDNQKVKVEEIDKSKEKSNIIKSESTTQPNENSSEEGSSGIVKTDVKNTQKHSENSESLPTQISDFEESENEAVQKTQIVSAPTSEIPTPSREPKAPTEKNKQVRSTDKSLPSVSEESDLSSFKESNQLVVGEEKTEQNQNEFLSEIFKNEVVTTQVEQLKNIDFLPAKKSDLPVDFNNFRIKNLPEVHLPFTKIEPIRNRRKGISVSATAGIYQTIEELSPNFKRDLPPLPPALDPDIRHQPNVLRGSTKTAGVDVRFDLGNHWSIKTGALYRRDNFTFRDEHNIKFKDFRTGQNPRDFETGIVQNTGNGLAAVRIQVKPKDGEMLRDEDNIKVNTKVERTTNYYSFPLSLNYRIDQGDWHFNFGAGILANFTASDSLSLELSLNDNPKLNRDKNLIQKRHPLPRNINKNYFNGMVNLGIEYDLSDHLSISLAPSFLFDLTEKRDLKKVDADFLSIGINAGVNYNF